MYKFSNFGNLIKKTGKKVQNQVKNFVSFPTLHEICGCHANVKNDAHTIDIKIFPRDE